MGNVLGLRRGLGRVGVLASLVCRVGVLSWLWTTVEWARVLGWYGVVVVAALPFCLAVLIVDVFRGETKGFLSAFDDSFSLRRFAVKGDDMIVADAGGTCSRVLGGRVLRT